MCVIIYVASEVLRCACDIFVDVCHWTIKQQGYIFFKFNFIFMLRICLAVQYSVSIHFPIAYGLTNTVESKFEDSIPGECPSLTNGDLLSSGRKRTESKKFSNTKMHIKMSPKMSS